MGKPTGLQWCDMTVNPTSGCDGCELWVPGQGGPCYAGNFHEARLSKSLPLLYDPVFTNIRLIPGRMAKAARCMDLVGRTRSNKPWLDGKRCKIFVGDLGDIFSAAVSFDYLKQEIFDIATNDFGKRHDWLLLTKQPNRALQFSTWLPNWPDNIWIGTSITGKASLARVKHLIQIKAKHRFLSLEPLVEAVDLSGVTGVDWVIVGGESNQGSRLGRPFQVKWARDVIRIGQATGTAVFTKQLGSNAYDNDTRLELIDTHGGDWDEWPADLRVRQFPFTCN